MTRNSAPPKSGLKYPGEAALRHQHRRRHPPQVHRFPYPAQSLFADEFHATEGRIAKGSRSQTWQRLSAIASFKALYTSMSAYLSSAHPRRRRAAHRRRLDSVSAETGLEIYEHRERIVSVFLSVCPVPFQAVGYVQEGPQNLITFPPSDSFNGPHSPSCTSVAS